ncbi:hypothetical protein J4465_03205 [Candidatus Pacearchaeota archaeon]|nr:hypothetical protein [uncultured archaeon]MBS3073775.1 hypothetical protein [Candidatus Pacearchaeota archaeon]
MFEKEELFIIGIVSLVLGFLLSLNLNGELLQFEFFNIVKNVIIMFLLFFIFVFSQKLAADFLDCKIKIKFLESERLSYQPGTKLKNWKFPWWFFLPVICWGFSAGLLNKWLWFSVTTFDVFPKTSRIKKRFFEPTEWDIARIVLAGTFSLLVLGLISKILGYAEYSWICNLFALTTLIPIGQGMKVFFGSKLLWVFAFFLTASIFTVGLIASTFSTILIALILAAFAVIVFYANVSGFGK